MNKIRTLSFFNLLALAVHIFMSVATQFKWLNNFDVGQVSNQFPTQFTPAGITFSVWGIIYVALMMMCSYHLIMSFRQPASHEANTDTARMNGWFIVNNIATAAWLYAWTHQQIGMAQLLIVFQLLSLVWIHHLLGIQAKEQSWRSKIFTQGPLSIYLGWISIATIANTAVYLTSIGWQAWGIDEAIWTVLMMGLALLFTTFMIFFRNNTIFGLVVIWALAGIILKQQQQELASRLVINAAWIGIAFTGTAMLIQAFRMHHHHQPGEMVQVKRAFSSDNV